MCEGEGGVGTWAGVCAPPSAPSAAASSSSLTRQVSRVILHPPPPRLSARPYTCEQVGQRGGVRASLTCVTFGGLGGDQGLTGPSLQTGYELPSPPSGQSCYCSVTKPPPPSTHTHTHVKNSASATSQVVLKRHRLVWAPPTPPAAALALLLLVF